MVMEYDYISFYYDKQLSLFSIEVGEIWSNWLQPSLALLAL